MANLSRDDVLKLARLSRLELSDEEVTNFTQELTDILQYVELLQSVPIDEQTPTHQVAGLTNVMREDELSTYGYAAEELLKNVPHQKDGQIQVARMVK